MSTLKRQWKPGSRRALTLLGMSGAVLAVLWFAVRGGESEAHRMLRGDTREALSSAAAGPVPELSLACVDEVRLKRGQTIEGALLENGLDRNRVASLLSGLSNEVDVRRLRPDDRFLLFRTRDGGVARLEYQRHPEERVVVEPARLLDGSGYDAYRERAPVRLSVRKLAGEVHDNLYLSLTDAGGDPGLVVEFADLFSWDFDFFTDTREGDRFEMLVEEREVDGRRTGFGRILAAGYTPVGSETPLEAYYYSWGDGPDDGGYYQPDGHSVRKFFLKSPLNYRRISSHFSHSRMHPILKKRRPHLGVDYAARAGTPVVALGNGRVTEAGWRGGYGRLVKIKHNATYITQYAHLSGFGKGIRAGVRVRQNQVIGYVGSSGLATGPHLDFRVMENGRWINPLSLKGGESEPLPRERMDGFIAERDSLRDRLERLDPREAVLVDGGQAPGTPQTWARLDTPSTP